MNSILAHLENIFHSYGFLIVFLSSLIEITPLGWTIPGGTILIIGGFFSFGKTTSLLGTIIFGWFGAWLTFILAYYLGGITGDQLINFLKQNKNAKKAERLLERNGGVILTSSMLANMIRFWVAYVAGIQKYNFIKFIFYSSIASLTWVSLMVMIGYIAGSERGTLESFIGKAGIIGWIFLVFALVIYYITGKRDFENFKEDKT